jgi:PAS domain S-box-containing protein
MDGLPTRNHRLARYGLAIAFVAAAWLVKLPCPAEFAEHTPYLLFPLAVVGSAFLGFGPSLVASVLSTFLAAVYFTPLSAYEPGAVGLTVVRLGAALAQMVGISALAYVLKRAKCAADDERGRAESAQVALRQRVEELETLLNMLPVAVFMAHDPDCEYIEGNRAGYHLLRQKPGSNLSVSGRGGDRTMFKILRDGRELPPEELPVQYAARHAVDVMGTELEMVDPDGTSVRLLGNAAPLFDESGKVRGAIAALTDVTAIKRAEEDLARSRLMFQRIAETTPDVLYVYDLRDRRIVYVNREISRMLGYSADEIAVPDFVAELVHPDDRLEGDIMTRIEALADGTVRERTYRVRRSDGDWRWIRSRDTVFSRGADGKPEQVLGVAQDVTELKAAQDALQEKAAEAERASRAKDDFLAALSHELRTPLTPVLMSVDAMRQDAQLAATVGAELEMIQRNIGMEARLIDDLLDLTRIARGKIELQLADVDAHAVLEQAMQTSADDSGQVKVIRLIRALTATPSRVRADASRLMQVFWNVLRNALKFTPDGGTVTVRTYNEQAKERNDEGGRMKDEEGPVPAPAPSFLIIEVTDTGIGISPERLPKLFTAFEQGDRSITRQFGGLGLGLAISKAIVELHGGTISATSQGTGRGATFRIALPLVTEPAAVEAAAPGGPTTAGAVAPGTAASNGPRLRVLLVEDDPTTLHTMAKLLRRQFEIHTATDVRSAKAMVDGQPLDLVVSDLGLPDGSGIEVMQYVRSKGDVPGIALSGFGMEEDVRRSIEAGFSEHLTKPVNLDRLKAVMDRVGNRRVEAGAVG